MARRAGVLAIGSNEGERRRRTIRRKLMLEVSTAEVSGALAGRRPAGIHRPVVDSGRAERANGLDACSHQKPEGLQ